MDNKLIAVFALLNPCVISIALPLPPYQRTQTGSLPGKLSSNEHDVFRHREDSKPYSWDSFDSERLSPSDERTYKWSNRFGEKSKLDTGEKKSELQLLRDIVAWQEGERLDEFGRSQKHTNEKRQRCWAGHLRCGLTRDAEPKRRVIAMAKALVKNGNGLEIEGRQTVEVQEYERQEVEQMLRELDARLKIGN